MRSLLWLALLLAMTGCSERAAPAESISAFASLAPLGEGATLVLRDGRFVAERALGGASGWPALDAALPARAHEPLHLALRDRADVWIDVGDLDVAPVPGSVRGGRVTYAGVASGVDSFVGLRGSAVESVRVLASPRASSTWRMRVAVGAAIATVRAREGRIEAVEASGYVPLASAPLLAIDAAGVERALEVSVRPLDARSFEVVATLDTHGVVFPVALDPLWSSAPSMSTNHDLHAATKLSDGRVLIAGGNNGTTTVATCEVFDPKTNTFSLVAPMTSGRAEHTATLLADGRVFVAFGASGTGTTKTKLSTAEIYDPKTNKWTDVTTTGFFKPVARVAHSATLLPSGDILLAGGVAGTSPETTTDRQVTYNPGTGVWNIPTDPGFASFMKQSRAYHAAVLVGSKVYVFGGEKLDTAGTATVLDSIESWSAATGWVLSSAKLAKARCETRATTTSTGAIMLVGGGSVCRPSIMANTPVAAGELYDPATEAVTSAPALTTARSRHSLTVLGSGQLLAVGGVGNTGGGGAYYSTAEIFDGKAWAPVASMAQFRFRHSATLLDDGRVLVVGSGADKSAELFAQTPLGSTCAAGGTCSSGFCVDGVCCDTKCEGACESCVAAGSIGTCKPIVGAPTGGRPKCDDGAGNTCKAKRCDGKSRDCVFVGSETTCSKPSCATGTAVAAAACNGIGACSTPTTKECAPYICGVDACRTDCTVDEQCVKGFTCISGACSSGAQCLPDGSSKGKDGTITPCAPYRCGGDGLCLAACGSSSDCASSATCDVGAKVCVAPTGGSEDSGGCAVTSGHTHGEAWTMLALLGLGLTARTSVRRARRAARRTSGTA